MEFKVPTSPLDDVDSVRLKLTITNSDGINSVTLAPAPLLIDRVQVFGQNGAFQLGTDITGMLWLESACPALPVNGQKKPS